MTFPILLNTESKDWSHEHLPVRSTMVGEGDSAPRVSWSECLMRALDQIDTPLVLYAQEDYFIDRDVRVDVIDRAIDLMMANPDIRHIALTKHASRPPYVRSPHDGFQTIAPNARYRIATQAALWRPEALRSYLHPRENGWMFEILGSRRAHRRSETFLVADFDPRDGGPAIDYIHTGIIKGRWHPGMPALFARHGIEMDFDRRGLYTQPDPLRRKMEVVRKLASDPAHVLGELLGRRAPRP